MKDLFKTLRFKIILGLLMVMLGFMLMAVYTQGAAPFFAKVTSFVTAPVQRVSSGIAGSVSEFFDKFVNVRSVYDENQLLREEVIRLRDQMVDYERIKHENSQYQDIIGLKEQHQDWVLKPASVISRQSTGSFYSFEIDKGTSDGVRYLDPVISSEGLVGYLSEVGYYSSTVTTILSPTVKVGAYDSTTRDIGVVAGTIDLASQGMCQMGQLSRDSGVAIGNIVLTSGGSGLFPKGIIIGTVQAIDPNSQGTSPVATIDPASDIRNVRDVFVITEFEGQGEE